MQSKIILIPLFKALNIATNGVQGGTSGDESTLDLNLPAFRNLLPHAEGITIYFSMTGRPLANTNLEWSIFLISGFDRDHEYPTPVNLLGANTFVNVNGSGRSTEYVNPANFLLESRLQLQYQNASGISGVNTASASAVAAVRTFGN